MRLPQFIRTLPRLVKTRLEARPDVPWLRWLKNAPQEVREAEQTARHALIYRQLPWGLLAALTLGIFKQFGHLTPFWIALLSAPGLIALMWPTYILRLARVTYRSIPGTTGALHWQLRAYATLHFILGSLMVCWILGMVAAVVFIAVTMPPWASA